MKWNGMGCDRDSVVCKSALQLFSCLMMTVCTIFDRCFNLTAFFSLQ